MERRGQTGWEPCFIYPRHGAETTEVVSEDQKGKKKKCHNKSLFILPKEQQRRHFNKTEFLDKCLFTQPSSTEKNWGLRINHIGKGQEEKVDFHFFQTVKLLCLPHLLVWSQNASNSACLNSHFPLGSSLLNTWKLRFCQVFWRGKDILIRGSCLCGLLDSGICCFGSLWMQSLFLQFAKSSRLLPY